MSYSEKQDILVFMIRKWDPQVLFVSKFMHIRFSLRLIFGFLFIGHCVGVFFYI